MIKKWAEEDGFESPQLLIQEVMTREAYRRYPMKATSEVDNAEILRN